MERYQNLLETRPASHSNFEFPKAVSPTVPNDVVFCGKVITRQTRPDSELSKPETLAKQNSGRTNGFTALLRSPSCMERRCRKSCSSNNKRYNGMFGTVKFPLQMDLSDIKMRQERNEPAPLPKFPSEEGCSDGGESCWELVRPLRRRGALMSVLAKASCGCFPIF
ncbi:hypothetical protein HN51_060373 [Arachis hypogaea]|uniref:Uncharacterized protein n=1 Tax=Arachis hypogaea TaxID=3818 RepID=A0A444X9I6_ARAHY|nr:uncharacterized protein DS421_13g445290 [Arachis hypogaea]RYQ86340.1 hypothetical protein Ahy_B10g106012 [Arachis hypogaea]